MNINEIISSGLLESYILGTTSAEESALIQSMCKIHPELIKEIQSIEEALMDYASNDIESLNENLKENISRQLTFNEDKKSQEDEVEAKVIPINSTTTTDLSLYRIGIAASILLLIMSGVYIYFIQQKSEKLNVEIASLVASKNELAHEIERRQSTLADINAKFQIVSNPKVKTITLNGMNSLASRAALIHWNLETNEVYFNASSLPSSPTNKQYQLWAIVNGKPVDAGVIALNGSSTFQKMNLIKGARAFAVTIEKSGGSVSPTLDTMCLLGDV